MRPAVAIFAIVAGLVLLLNFKTPDQPRAPGPTAVIPSQQPDVGSSSTATAQATASAVPTPSASAQAAGSVKDGQYTGQDVPNRFGDVQVKVTISGGRITDVQAIQLPYDRPRSQEISQAVGPILHDEALQAQNAQIDTLSGATYTSYGYAQSLQSALDMARG
ncbi:MAG: FMN-binding protein [Candidatus Dormiibacterota bacterium]